MTRRSGSTLLEVLLAVGVPDVVMVALASLHLASVRTTRSAQRDGARVELAVDRLEREKRLVESGFASYLACKPAVCRSEPGLVNGTQVTVNVTGRPDVSTWLPYPTIPSPRDASWRSR